MQNAKEKTIALLLGIAAVLVAAAVVASQSMDLTLSGATLNAERSKPSNSSTSSDGRNSSSSSRSSSSGLCLRNDDCEELQFCNGDNQCEDVFR